MQFEASKPLYKYFNGKTFFSTGNIPVIPQNIENIPNNIEYYHMFPKMKPVNQKSIFLRKIFRRKINQQKIQPDLAHSHFSQLPERTQDENIISRHHSEQPFHIFENQEYFPLEKVEGEVERNTESKPISLLYPLSMEKHILPASSCVSTNQYQCRINYEYCIEISHDYGETWKTPTTPPPENCQISTIAKTPSGKYQISAGVYDSIYNSDDYGETWLKARNQPQIRRWSNVYISENGEKREACMDDGTTYFSLDFGDTWDKL